MFTQGLARELGARGITVNNVQPGPIDTALNPASGELATDQKAAVPLGRCRTTSIAREQPWRSYPMRWRLTDLWAESADTLSPQSIYERPRGAGLHPKPRRRVGADSP